MASRQARTTTTAVRLPSAGALASALGVLDQRLLGVALGGLVVLAIGLIELAELALPLSSDQALYSFIGRAIHHGAVPYRDFVDLKPPGIFYLRAALDVIAPLSWTGACFGGPTAASCGWVVVKLADVLTTALFAAGLYALARLMEFDRLAAYVAAALGAVYVSLSVESQLGLSPEKLAAGGALLAVLLAARGQSLAAGAAAGGAVLMKQPSGTVLVPLVLLAITQARRPAEGWRRIGLSVVGFLSVLIVVGAVLGWQGALGPALEYTLGINLERIRTPASLGGFGGDDALHVIWQAFRDGLAPLWLLGGAGVLASARLPARWRLVLLGWALVDALLLLRLREVLQLAPSLALLGGWAAGCLWRAAGQPPFFGLARAGFARLALLGVVASLVLLSGGYQESIIMRALNERSVHGVVRSPDEFVADALAKVPPGSLYVWGEGSELYLLSQRAPAARTLNAIPLSANLPGAAARRAQLIAELQASQPVAIVVSPDAERAGTGLAPDGFPEFKSLLQAAYMPLDEVSRDPKYGGWRVYVRRTAA